MKFKVGTTAAIAGAFAAGLVAAPLVGVPVVSAFAQADGGRAETYRLLSLFGDVFGRVRAEYVEPVRDRELVENALNGMLSGLDPHSSYLSPRNFEDMRVQTRGEFGGLGIEVTQENGFIRVISPIDETPAARAGVKPGDLIIALNGNSTQGLTLQEAVEQMRGERGTAIRLTIRREGETRPIELSLTRDVIRPQVVRFRMEGTDIGYIRLTSFNEQTEVNLRRAVTTLRQQAGANLRGLVLDLRNNPGGLLDQAVQVTDDLLEQGEIVPPGAARRGGAALERPRRRHHRRPAHGHPDQRRLRLGLGDRGGRPAGPPPRRGAGHPLLRQGLRADGDPARRQQRRHPADHGALLHALRPLHPVHRHRAGRGGARHPAGGRDHGQRPPPARARARG
jgi:carboxyl-terminal processing protease